VTTRERTALTHALALCAMSHVKKSNFEEMSFSRYWYKQLFAGACYCCANNLTKQTITKIWFLSKKLKVVIKALLRQENGYGAKKFIKKFLNKNWSIHAQDVD